MKQNNTFNEEFENDFDLKVFLDKYLGHWYWFVLVIFLCLVLAYVKLRYTIPQYKATTTILIKDDNKGGVMSELSAISDFGVGRGKRNLENEIEILKSRTLIENTVKKSSLYLSFFIEGKVMDQEIYGKTPINLVVLNTKNNYDESSFELVFNKVTANTFSLTDNSGILTVAKKSYTYDEVIPTLYGNLVISKSEQYDRIRKSVTLVKRPLEHVVSAYKSQLNVELISKQSNVVALNMTGPIMKKSEDFLNNLVLNYNEAAAADKNYISEKTAEFIANRLAKITQELDGVEQNVEGFKSSNNLIDVQSEVPVFVAGSTEYNKQVVEIDIQLNIVSSVLDFLNKSTNSDLLPTNIISGEGDASALIRSYNEFVLNRNRILKTATVNNPSVIKLDEQIKALKANIINSLLRLKSTLTIQKRDLNANKGLFDNKLKKIPAQERQFRAIARQQKVKEELYLYLLQKREETAISLSATEPNARVVDIARSYPEAVSPNKNKIYLAAVLIGFLIPFGVIYLKDLLDTKIKSRLDIEGKTQIPFIGDVPTSDTPNEVMKTDSRSSSAEALRIVRTNLEFMLSKVPDGLAKTIFLTSTFPKEGKTFVSVNLAATFALSGKRVLLIGMDIRNPRLDDYLKLPDRGFTNYLSSGDLKLEDLIVKQPGYEDFYVLPAGVIPPNPAELLMSKRVDALFENIKKQYDYIIVDTAPVSLVTDTLLIAKHADTFIYVARANFLEKRMLDIPNSLYRDNKLLNMCILLNDTDSTKGYGYGYGYGVKVEKPNWYRNIIRR